MNTNNFMGSSSSNFANQINNSGGQTRRRTGDVVPKGYRKGQIQQYTPEQLDLFEQMFGNVGPDSYQSRLAGGDEDIYNEIEAPALRQFNELQGGLASRFSRGGGQGSLSGRRSSGFQNTSTAAASNFAQQLQAQRHGLRQQAIQDLMEMSGQLLDKRPYQQTLNPKNQKQSSGFGGLIGAGLGGVGGFLAGGPAGALTGANLGYNVGSSF